MKPSSSSTDRRLASVDLDLEADLMDAFRSVRNEYDGASPDADLTLQRALFRTRKKTQKQRLIHWVLLPAAAVLIASTAFAGVTGHLQPAVRSVLEAFHSSPTTLKKTPEPPPPPAPQSPIPEPIPDPEPAPEATPEAKPEAKPTPAPTHPPPLAAPVRAISKPIIAAPPPATSSPDLEVAPPPPPPPPPPPSVVTGDPTSPLFAEAHRLHFIDRDPARALVAWDRYLASSPDPRFAPEARYNRALTLVRLARIPEAKRELLPFASGTYGPYHREDAKALLTRLNQ